MEGYRPLGDRVLVRRLAEETKTEGGVLLPENAKEKRYGRGVVVAVGPGRRLRNGTLAPVEVPVGVTVLLDWHSGLEVKVRGEKLLSVTEQDIMGIEENEQ